MPPYPLVRRLEAIVSPYNVRNDQENETIPLLEVTITVPSVRHFRNNLPHAEDLPPQLVPLYTQHAGTNRPRIIGSALEMTPGVLSLLSQELSNVIPGTIYHRGNARTGGISHLEGTACDRPEQQMGGVMEFNIRGCAFGVRMRAISPGRSTDPRDQQNIPLPYSLMPQQRDDLHHLVTDDQREKNSSRSGLQEESVTAKKRNKLLEQGEYPQEPERRSSEPSGMVAERKSSIGAPGSVAHGHGDQASPPEVLGGTGRDGTAGGDGTVSRDNGNPLDSAGDDSSVIDSLHESEVRSEDVAQMQDQHDATQEEASRVGSPVNQPITDEEEKPQGQEDGSEAHPAHDAGPSAQSVLEARNKSLEREIHEAHQETKRVRMQLTSQEKKAHTAKASLDASLEQSEKEIKRLQNKLDSTQAQLRKRADEVLRLKDQVEDRENSCKAQAEEINIMNRDIKRLNAKMDKLEEDRAGLTAHVTGLQEDLDMKYREISSLETEKRKYQLQAMTVQELRSKCDAEGMNQPGAKAKKEEIIDALMQKRDQSMENAASE